MVMQPNRTQGRSDLLAFDSSGTTLYGLNTIDSEFGLRRIQVLADGLAEQSVVTGVGGYVTRSLGFTNNRVIAGRALYDAPMLTGAGAITGASDCWPQGSVNLLLCFGDVFGEGRILVANSGTLAVGASTLYASSDHNFPPYLVQGPAGQVAISYPALSNSAIRLFSSPELP